LFLQLIIKLTNPNSHHSNRDLFFEFHSNQVVPAGRKRSQPEMHVISRQITPIRQVVCHTRIAFVLRQYVDVGWVGLYTLDDGELTGRCENLDTIKANVVFVAPRCSDVYDKFSSFWQKRNLKTRATTVNKKYKN